MNIGIQEIMTTVLVWGTVLLEIAFGVAFVALLIFYLKHRKKK